MRSGDPFGLSSNAPGRRPRPETYELWHARSKNLHGAYRSRRAALAGVRQALREQGEAYVRELILAATLRDETRRIAGGDDLLHLARRADGSLAPTPSLETA